MQTNIWRQPTDTCGMRVRVCLRVCAHATRTTWVCAFAGKSFKCENLLKRVVKSVIIIRVKLGQLGKCMSRQTGKQMGRDVDIRLYHQVCLCVCVCEWAYCFVFAHYTAQWTQVKLLFRHCDESSGFLQWESSFKYDLGFDNFLFKLVDNFIYRYIYYFYKPS